jgi:hypothetical protein
LPFWFVRACPGGWSGAFALPFATASAAACSAVWGVEAVRVVGRDLPEGGWTSRRRAASLGGGAETEGLREGGVAGAEDVSSL